jgi:nicotinamidase-related amidase
MITLPASSTALILVDLQKGIVSLPVEPRSGEAVLSAAKTLAGRFRDASAPVVLINVDFSPDFADALKAPVDQPPQLPAGGLPKGWSDLADGLAEAVDIRITKHQWGAFYGTELDLQLRRRGVSTVVVAGIATNFGVESTARAAHERGYAVVVVEDGCAGLSEAMHSFAFTHILPRLGRVARVDDVEFMR